MKGRENAASTRAPRWRTMPRMTTPDPRPRRPVWFRWTLIVLAVLLVLFLLSRVLRAADAIQSDSDRAAAAAP